MTNTIIYKIFCNNPECLDVFVSHTTNFAQKKHLHKVNSINVKKMCSLYATIRKYGGWDNWEMSKLMSVSVEDVEHREKQCIGEHGHTLSTQEPVHRYMCECCNLYFPDNFKLDRHFSTKKHLRIKSNISADDKETSTDMIKALLTQNGELARQLIESSKEKTINTNCHNSSTTINNKFNLNFFLNTTCKNALTIDEFISQIPFQLSDLEATGESGFAPGISRILTKSMKHLEMGERPIHCSDAKRETLYIKNNSGWSNDNDRKIMEKAIYDVARKNRNMLPIWQDEHPNYKDYDSKENTLYMRILGNAMVGGTDEEIERNLKKIAHNVAQEAIIMK